MYNTLRAVGLTENEAKAYIALFKIGTAATGAILKQSGMNTGKIYEVLESLKTKGLIAESEMNGVRQFSVGPSKNLQKYLDKKCEELADQERQVKELIPQLDALARQTKPKIRTVTYTGFRGFLTAVDEASEMLEPKDELRGMGLRTQKHEQFSRFWQKWTREHKTRQRVIFSERGDHYEKTVAAPTAQARVLESLTPSTVVLFGTKAALLLQYDEPVSVIAIYDQRTVQSFATFFEQLWKISKR